MYRLTGLNVLSLENDLLRITVLPDKGADIYEFIYKPKNLDFYGSSTTA